MNQGTVQNKESASPDLRVCYVSRHHTNGNSCLHCRVYQSLFNASTLHLTPCLPTSSSSMHNAHTCGVFHMCQVYSMINCVIDQVSGNMCWEFNKQMVVCGNIQMLCYLLFTLMLTVVPQYIKCLIGSLLPWRFVLALIALQYFSLSGNVMRRPQWNLFPTRPLGCSASGGGRGTFAYQNTDLIKSATVCSNL